jgi:hypothetical protein
VGWALGGNTAKFSAYQEQTSPKLGESSRTKTNSNSVSLSLGDALTTGVTNRESRKTFHEEEWRYEKARRDLETEVKLAVQRVNGRGADGVKPPSAKAEEAQQELKDSRALLQDDRAHLGDYAVAKNRVAFAHVFPRPVPGAIFGRALRFEPRRRRGRSVSGHAVNPNHSVPVRAEVEKLN